MIQLPRLLDAQGKTARVIHPSRVSITLAITPLSYASIELPPGEDSLPERGYVEMFTPMGSAGIFRVRSPQDAYGDATVSAELEHAVVEVGDYVITSEYKSMMSPQDAMRTIFGHYKGTKWQLAEDLTVLGTRQVAVQIEYDRVLEAMLGILEQVPSCMMTFNFQTSPWTIGFAPRGSVVLAEGRLSRNIQSARITYDDTELCTRAYYECETTTEEVLSGYPTFVQSSIYSKGQWVIYGGKLYELTNGHAANVAWGNTAKTQVTMPSSGWNHIDSDTIGTYGLIERTVPTSSNFTAAEALWAAQEYLRKHKHPRISVEISAEDLSGITGEAWDTFEIGKLFRLALPDYGNRTVEEVITSMTWQDVYESPEAIIVSLAEEEDTAITFLHDVDAKGGSGGGGGGRKKKDDEWKEFRSLWDVQDKYIEGWVKQLDTHDAILRQSGMMIDADGTLIYARDTPNMLASHIQVQADRISLVVEGTGENASIKGASIVAQINSERGSTIKLSADTIDIDGLLSVFSAKIASLIPEGGEINVTGDFNVGGDLGAGTLSVESGSIFIGDCELTLSPYDAGWHDKSVVTGVTITFPSYTMTSRHSFGVVDTDLKVTGRYAGQLITGTSAGDVTVSKDTIYYLGR